MRVQIFGLSHRVDLGYQTRGPRAACSFHKILYGPHADRSIIKERRPAERRNVFINLKNQNYFSS